MEKYGHLLYTRRKGGRIDYIGNKKDIMPKVDRKYAEYIAQYRHTGEIRLHRRSFLFRRFCISFVCSRAGFYQRSHKWAFLAASLLAILLSLKYGIFIDIL
jgi:hypothetical protein